WLSSCDESHGFHCSMGPGKATRLNFRVIDVNRQCIVQASSPCRYTALSYVWGRVQQPLLRVNQIDAWEEPGSLLGVDLPTTVRDAIRVCKMLGLEYLWVDSLCIVQDSPDDVEHQIVHMDSIYRKAYLTIIAAAGEDCKSGLPSIRPRDPVQYTADVQGLKLGTVFRSVKDELLNSKWNTRAWTLQEFALSYRCLIFTPRQIFYSC
ncbi:HET-domain-containing protein, partial [Aulographum hederae CBS 113979]